MAGVLYHDASGRVLAYCPGGRDEEFEWELRRAAVTFRVFDNMPAVPPDQFPMASVLRQEQVEQPDGSLLHRHYLHHEDGTKYVVRKKVIRPTKALGDVALGQGRPATTDLTTPERGA